MRTETRHDSPDDALVAKLEAAQHERASARRQFIEERVAAGERGDKDVQVGLKAFHGICHHWAVDEKDAEAILFAENKKKASSAQLLERISYVMRIYGLIIDVVQSDQARHQRWIRRSNSKLGGQRPIDLMTSGPQGSAKVMEYLEFCKHGHSS